MEHNFFITKIYDLLTSCEDADRSEKIIIIDEIFTCIANNIHLFEGEYGLINIIRSKLIHFYEDENWEKASTHYFAIFGEEILTANHKKRKINM